MCWIWFDLQLGTLGYAVLNDVDSGHFKPSETNLTAITCKDMGMYSGH